MATSTREHATHRLAPVESDLSTAKGRADWTEAWRGLFEVGAFQVSGQTSPARLEAWTSGRSMLTRAQYSGLSLRRDARVIRLGMCDAYVVRAVLAGDVTGRAGARNIKAHAGDVLSLDLAREVELFADAPNDEATLWLPRAFIGDAPGIADSIHGLVLSGTTPAAAMLRAMLQALGEGAAKTDAAEFEELIACAADLAIKTLRRFAKPGLGQETSSPLETFITIRKFIDRNLASPKLGSQMIAASFGLSRSTLYRLFEPVGGLSVYIRDARMRRIYEEITSPSRANRRIGPAAFGFGFKNFSAFSRAFREIYGMSPAEARKASLIGAGPQPSEVEPLTLSRLCRSVNELRV